MKCLACGNDRTLPVVSFGNQPAANLLLDRRTDPFELAELGVNGCVSCGHLQQIEFFSPKKLFEHYLYQSGTSQSLSKYFSWLAKNLGEKFNRGSMLEIASNDGSFLEQAGRYFDKKVGIDPAKNICSIATSKGLEIINDFFPSKQLTGTFDCIVAMNVIAHTPSPINVMEGISAHLAPGGMAFVQTSQADMLENGEYDTIYHEHYSFFSISSMSALANRSGLEVFRTDVVDVHGGSFAFFLRRLSDKVHFEYADNSLVCRSVVLADQSANWQSKFESYKNKVQGSINSTKSFIQATRGLKLAFVGVAAKSVTLIQATGLEPDYVLDEAPLKIGKYVAGQNHVVLPLAYASEMPDNVVFVIGAWNFKTELAAKIRSFRGRPSLFCTIAPNPEFWIH